MNTQMTIILYLNRGNNKQLARINRKENSLNNKSNKEHLDKYIIYVYYIVISVTSYLYI